MKRLFTGFLMTACMLACPLAGAKCTPAHLPFDTVLARNTDLQDAAKNLGALLDSSDASDAALLSQAGAVAQDNANMGILFMQVLQLYRSMESAGDRERTADLIASNAKWLGEKADKSADTLTNFAAAMPHYSAEIQSARDKMRAWARLFSCRY